MAIFEKNKMNNSGIQIFTTKDGKTEIEVQLDNETVWLNQYQLESLFETDRTSINRHISNIYKTEELEEKSTCAKIAQVQKEGDREIKRKIKFYNLDVIIAVGYRVNSKRGTEFRHGNPRSKKTPKKEIEKATRLMSEYFTEKQKEDKKMKTTSWSEIKDRVYGEKGTERRDELEKDFETFQIGLKLREAQDKWAWLSRICRRTKLQYLFDIQKRYTFVILKV